MFDTLKNWFSPAQETENKWDARNVELQQPNSPSGPNMSSEAVTQQPVCNPHILSQLEADTPRSDQSGLTTRCSSLFVQGGPEQMNVHMRGGGEGEDVCCGV